MHFNSFVWSFACLLPPLVLNRQLIISCINKMLATILSFKVISIFDVHMYRSISFSFVSICNIRILFFFSYFFFSHTNQSIITLLHLHKLHPLVEYRFQCYSFNDQRTAPPEIQHVNEQPMATSWWWSISKCLQ